MKIKVANGNIEIDIYELIQEAMSGKDEEELEDIYNSLMWSSPVYKELISTTRKIGVSENYNSKFFEFFKDLFCFPAEYSWENNEEIVFKQMSTAMKEILKENARLRAELRLSKTVPVRIIEWIKYKYSHIDNIDSIAWEIYSKIIDLQRRDENGNRYDQSTQMAEEIPYKDWVKEWADSIYKIFNKTT